MGMSLRRAAPGRVRIRRCRARAAAWAITCASSVCPAGFLSGADPTAFPSRLPRLAATVSRREGVHHDGDGGRVQTCHVDASLADRVRHRAYCVSFSATRELAARRQPSPTPMAERVYASSAFSDLVAFSRYVGRRSSPRRRVDIVTAATAQGLAAVAPIAAPSTSNSGQTARQREDKLALAYRPSQLDPIMPPITPPG